MPVSSSPICIWHAAGMPILASRMWATAPVLLLGLALFCEHHKPQVILRFRQETLLQLLQWWDV